MGKADLRLLSASLANLPATKIPVGARTIDESIFERNRGDCLDAIVNELTNRDDKAINERHTVIDHCGRVRVRNGLGEWIV